MLGNIKRFPNANKLAKFVGIAPINFSSAGKGKNMTPKQGNRKLQAIFFYLGHSDDAGILPRYTEKPGISGILSAQGGSSKNKKQVLIYIARRLV